MAAIGKSGRSGYAARMTSTEGVYREGSAPPQPNKKAGPQPGPAFCYLGHGMKLRGSGFIPRLTKSADITEPQRGEGNPAEATQFS